MRTVADIAASHSRNQPDRAAFIFLKHGETEEETLTYGELYQRVSQVAAGLVAAGAAGQRALLVYTQGLDFIVAFLACLRAQVVAVPLPVPQVNDKNGRFASIQRNSQAKFVLTTQGLVGDVTRYFTEKPAFIVTDTIYSGSVDQVGGAFDKAPDPSRIAFLQYTSGSTGHPKGVVITHRNLMHNQSMIQAAFGTSERTVSVSWIPSYHDMGLIGSILGSIHSGATCILMAPLAFVQKPIRWLRAISKYRATTSGAPNFAYHMCAQKIREEQMDGLDLSSWSLAFCGAEPIRSETIAQFTEKFAPIGFRRKAFYPCYGLAEATLFVTGPAADAGPMVRSFSRASIEKGLASAADAKTLPDDIVDLVGCGEAWGGQEVQVVAPDSLSACGPRHIGEIWVSGPSVADGYWNNSEESGAVFGARLRDAASGAFLRTGDLGFLYEGQLFVAGRLKDMIIIKGRNHYPADIESSVHSADPAFRQDGCVAFSIPRDGGEALVVIQEIERRKIPGANVSMLCTTIRSCIARMHALDLADVLIVPPASLSRTSSGKIRRGECRRLYLDNYFSDCALTDA